MEYKNIKKVITIIDPNMQDEDVRKGLKIQEAILNGECDKCKYLKECENGKDIKSKDAYCNKGE